MSRVRYILNRTLHTVFLLFFVLTFLFFLFRLMPGSYADAMLFSGASQEAVDAFEEAWGLNDPLYSQYWDFIINYLTLNPGRSVVYRIPVVDYVAKKLFNTFILIGPAITIAYVLGTVLGAVLGTSEGSFKEKYGPIPIIVLGTFPIFFTGMLLITFFAGFLDIFPTGGMVTTSTYNAFDDWWRVYFTSDFLWHYSLPFVAIVLRYLYLPTLVMRTSVVEVLGQDFIEYYRLTGIPRGKVRQYIGRHSVLPVITLWPVSMTRSIGGMVLLEVVFNWPGIGSALVNAVLNRDFPVVQFIFFLSAAFIIIGNFAIDILYGFIDPRVTIGEDRD